MDASQPAAQRLVLSLHRATALVDRVADRYLRPAHGIGIGAFAMLVTIEAIGPARQRAIADAMDVTRAAVTQRLDDLAGKGLVEIAPDATDSRANLVSLTDAGRDLLTAAWIGLAALDDGIEVGVDLVALQKALDTMSANAARYLAGAGDVS